ncbi:MAG: hypothetical protein ACI38Z_04335 [Parafannyhessea sp.]|uniref:hypothetical protein n=1 Tax=Parafannyhessea sp. TaxID=2847324 RepID=UPI003EFE27D4
MKKSTALIGCGLASVALFLSICYLMLNNEAKDSLRTLLQLMKEKSNESAEASKTKDSQATGISRNKEKTRAEWEAIGY